MKKKTLGLLAAILSVCMLAGCGAKDTGNGSETGTATDSTVLKDMDVDKYVTLGEYKGLAASVDTVEVDEDEWDTLVNNVWKYYRGERRYHGSCRGDRRHRKH